MLYTLIIGGLTALIIVLLIWIIIIKRNINETAEELAKTRDEEYNRHVRITLTDKSVEKLAAEINKNIDYQKSLKLETEQSRQSIKQSVSDIAHDLRTPLTVIKGNLQMLEKEELSPKARENLRISEQKADTLKEMVDEFFEMSVLDSDSSSVILEKIDIVGFLAEFVIENETLIREKGLTPEINFPGKSVYVMADRKMLGRVFSNLMTNILKYAEESFFLTVEGADEGCSILLGNKVRDPEAIDVERIFDRTYRADKARSVGGAGLGLYIAKLLVEKQKGTIDARPDGDNLVFCVKLT
ncbi:MAG: HAMP domain-containing histidine kinase [Eubacterium sp.]|nr:HAMP domain-containing histidine kinase [Eubacterium sp.]